MMRGVLLEFEVGRKSGGVVCKCVFVGGERRRGLFGIWENGFFLGCESEGVVG